MAIHITVKLITAAAGLLEDKRKTEKNKLNWWKCKCFQRLPSSTVSTAIVIYVNLYRIFSTFCVITVKRRDKVQRPEYTTCKVKDRKVWLLHIRGYGCLKAFSLWAVIRSGERGTGTQWLDPTGTPHLRGGTGTQRHRSACTDLVVVTFFPKLSSPSFPSLSSTCGFDKSQI